MSQFVEIRAYNLKPGTRQEFHRLFLEESLPMLRRRQTDVVAYGPSRHDDTSWFLVRAYASLDDRQASNDAFYGSDEWRNGPRQAVLDCIESGTEVVVAMDAAAIDALRGAVG